MMSIVITQLSSPDLYVQLAQVLTQKATYVLQYEAFQVLVRCIAAGTEPIYPITALPEFVSNLGLLENLIHMLEGMRENLVGQILRQNPIN